ncbi:MAG: calcium/sodium antiporter [Candidatus Coprenecus sp.]
MILDIVILLVGLALILFGAEFLVNGSSFIARKFGISEFVVGMTIVGIGTSTPELVVSMISAINGSSDISVGNIVGSNISNVYLILGVTALIAPISLTKSNKKYDLPISIFISLMLALLLYDSFIWGAENNVLSRVDGIILLILFGLFMLYSFKFVPKEEATESENQEGNSIYESVKHPMLLAVVSILGGLAGLVIGGRFFVNSGSAIASELGVSDAFIGITVMALGTSLPELAASIVAAAKKKGQMALGNILGSNIFNITLILGLTSLVSPLSPNDITPVDMGMMISTSILPLLFALLFNGKKITRTEGLLFFLIYIGYVVYLSMNL